MNCAFAYYDGIDSIACLFLMMHNLIVPNKKGKCRYRERNVIIENTAGKTFMLLVHVVFLLYYDSNLGRSIIILMLSYRFTSIFKLFLYVCHDIRTLMHICYGVSRRDLFVILAKHILVSNQPTDRPNGQHNNVNSDVNVWWRFHINNHIVNYSSAKDMF